MNVCIQGVITGAVTVVATPNASDKASQMGKFRPPDLGMIPLPAKNG